MTPEDIHRETTHSAEDDPRNRDILIYVDGALKHRDDAKVSVYDSGFMLGDGMWEGMRLYNGKWAFIEDHMDRLYDSCKAVALDIGLSRAELIDALEKTRLANDMTHDVHCRLMVTRGVKVRPFQHPSLSRSGPTIVIIMEHSKPVDTLQSRGIRLATVPQVRGLPMSQDAKYNSHSKLNCVIACLQAEQAGADEGLMLDPQGFVNTTNACNFFIVRKGEVWTSTGDYCMNGVTRRKVIDLCQKRRHSGLRAQLFACRCLWRGRGVPDRHLRRPDPGGRDRRTQHRHRRRTRPGLPPHPRALQGSRGGEYAMTGDVSRRPALRHQHESGPPQAIREDPCPEQDATFPGKWIFGVFFPG